MEEEWRHEQGVCEACGEPAVWFIIGSFNHLRCSRHRYVMTIETANLCFYKGEWVKVWDQSTKGHDKKGIGELRENGLKKLGIPFDGYLGEADLP